MSLQAGSAFALAMLFPLGLAVALDASGCCADTRASSDSGVAAFRGGGGSGGGTSASAAGTAGSVGVGGIGIGGDQNTGGLDRDAACVATSAQASLVKRPVDIVFIVDNSGSMGDNIESVQNNINASFAAIIGASDVDYRVVMISEHGALGSESICVGAPLSTTDCDPVPAQPGENPPIFFQYSIPINSHDSWCQVIRSYDGSLPDGFGLAPGGWREWLRAEAFKVFVEITDDRVVCALDDVLFDDKDSEVAGQVAAEQFDAALLALDPAQFGDAAKRNYMWHSIVGLLEDIPPDAAYVPADPVVTSVCSTAVNSGTGYQRLSQTTGGLRFPICQFASFDVVFQEIAKGIIEGAKVACEFPVPEAPAGETIDLDTVVLAYTPGDGGPTQKLKQVASLAKCAPSAFYIEDLAIFLCPDACALVQADDAAKLDILFGCQQDLQ